MTTRIWVILMSALLFMAIPSGLYPAIAGGAAPKVIKISAKRFEYNPSEITLKKGVPVILQLSSEDRTHGFNIPAMKVRTDIVPGKTTELKITPDKSGDFDFFCDVFCGSGHEGMSGKIKVAD